MYLKKLCVIKTSTVIWTEWMWVLCIKTTNLCGKNTTTTDIHIWGEYERSTTPAEAIRYLHKKSTQRFTKNEQATQPGTNDENNTSYQDIFSHFDVALKVNNRTQCSDRSAMNRVSDIWQESFEISLLSRSVRKKNKSSSQAKTTKNIRCSRKASSSHSYKCSAHDIYPLPAIAWEHTCQKTTIKGWTMRKPFFRRFIKKVSKD